MFSLCKEAYDIVDLSLTLSEDLPGTWPGHRQFEHNSWATITGEEEPYRTSYLIMDEHCGTHCDAPSHFIPPPESHIAHASPAGSITGEKLDLAAMQGPLAVIDVRDLNAGTEKGKSSWIEPHVIQAWEEQYHELEEGTVVVFRTGWDRLYTSGEGKENYINGPIRDNTYPGWPAPSIASLEYLYNKNIICLGIDAASMGAVHYGVEPHLFGLSREMIFIEGLGHLERVPPAGGYFVFLPIKLGNSSGCPGRAIAYVEKDKKA